MNNLYTTLKMFMVVPKSNEGLLNSYPVFHTMSDVYIFLNDQQKLLPPHMYEVLKVIEVSVMVESTEPFLQAINK